jgi:fructose-bisphosphate aldolase class I
LSGKENAMSGTGQMAAQMAGKGGFIAALDQSGGSTPGALRNYGIPDDAYRGETEMFRLVHEMRVRIMTSPAFTGDKVIGAILFERTMDGEVRGKPTPSYLWEDRGVVPFLKVDKGLEAETDSVRLMKPIEDLDALLQRAASLGIYGTKMRSVIGGASRPGIAAIVRQQFDIARRIAAHGLMPIIEPEVSIEAPDKSAAEEILLHEINAQLGSLEGDRNVMFKLTIPSVPDLYAPLIGHARVQRVVALSGGYPRDEACRLLATNHGMIASFSRALIDDLRASMSDTAFDTALRQAIDEIYDASVNKT